MEGWLVEVDDLPVLLGLIIILLNGVDVLLCGVGDPTEHIHELLLEAAARMVVPPLIQ